MRRIIGNRQKVVLRSDLTPFSVRLGVVSWNAKFACPGIVAKIFIEGMILLASNKNMLDRVGRIEMVARHRCPHLVYGQYTGIEGKTSSCQYSQLLQHTASRLTSIEPLIHEHLFLSTNNKNNQGVYKKNERRSDIVSHIDLAPLEGVTF